MRWWDVPDVLVLERRLFPQPWTEATFWSELARVPETRHYVITEINKVLVGYAGLLVVGRQADVQTLAVAADHQGRGLGALLLRHLLERAEARGAHEVLLEVRADNGAAQRLYQRFGFEQIARRRGYYDDGADALVLRCRPPRHAA